MLRSRKKRIKSNYSDNIFSYSSAPSSSRMIKKEKRKVLTQSILMILGAIITLLIFISVILPGFFGLIARIFDSPIGFIETDRLPPQAPIISAPVSATNSASLVVYGFAEPEGEVVFVLNNKNQDPTPTDDEGAFSYELILTEGPNRITAFSIDEDGNESVKTREYLTILDTQPPEIEIIEPENGSVFESRTNQSVTIKGTTDEGGDVRLYINGRVVFPNDNGEFSHTLMLEEGENKIEIRAEDKAGNESVLELTYHFSL
jgi:hypothetical protein